MKKDDKIKYLMLQRLENIQHTTMLILIMLLALALFFVTSLDIPLGVSVVGLILYIIFYYTLSKTQRIVEKNTKDLFYKTVEK